MNRGITIGWKGTGKSAIPEVLVTPEVSFSDQRRNFRTLRAQLTGYSELELWSSGSGRVKRYRFKSKTQAVTPPASPAKDTTTELTPAPDSVPSSPTAPKAKKAKKPSGKKSPVQGKKK